MAAVYKKENIWCDDFADHACATAFKKGTKMKIKMEAIDESHAWKSVKEFEVVQLSDLIREFEYFIKSCGYHFSGELQIVETEHESF